MTEPPIAEPFTLDGNEHPRGDAGCSACWGSFPKACDNGPCPGLIHAEWGDYDSNGDYWLFTKCDVCGEPL